MSFFAKRAKPKPEASAALPDSSRNLFSHSGSFLTQQKERIEREKRQAEKEKEREQRRKDKKERKESAKRESGEEDSPERKPDLKRRRISSKESEKLLVAAGLPSGPIELDSSDDEAGQPSAISPVRRSPRHTRTTTDDYGLSKSRSRLSQATAAPINVWEDDLQITGSAAVSAPAQASSDVEEEFSDPELAEMSRKARRAARAKQAPERRVPPPGDNVYGEATGAESDSKTGLPTPELHDPIVTIFITSDIPNTGSLLIRRKMSQPLGKVRTAWCERYGLSSQMRDEVFLTFCGRRQYDSTTCQRLGLKVDSYGRCIREDGNTDEPNDQVHVEAFTEALFAERKAEKARQVKAGGASKYDIDEAEDAEPEPAPAEIKIIIRAKGKDDFKLKVSPVSILVLFVWCGKADISQHHSFAKITKVAKKAFGIGSEQAVRIEFDGEAIDPDQLVRDTEIEDMDTMDMYLES